MQQQEEVRKSTTENISLILFIKQAIEKKITLDPDTARFIITTNWDKVYPHFAKTPDQEAALLALSPFFLERANRGKKINPKEWINLSSSDLFLFIKEK